MFWQMAIQQTDIPLPLTPDVIAHRNVSLLASSDANLVDAQP